MPPLPMYGKRPMVLLTNDDGPPCPSSPNIYGFCKYLQSKLGWEVRVVIPDTQKSWVGKAYAISEVVTVSYFYPLEPDGLTGDVTTQPRPLKEGETMEWVLLAGTPASCTNIALHNLYPGEIDMVISGPNHGRNSSAAFSLSSGTLGAALGGALSVPVPGPSSGISQHQDHIPSIAVSYGVCGQPATQRATELAHDAAVDVCKRLWEDWGYEDAGPSRRPVQVYSVNIPLLEHVLELETRKVCWTSMWRNAYGGLFKSTKSDKAAFDPMDDRHKTLPKTAAPPAISNTGSAGPGALPTPDSSIPLESSDDVKKASSDPGQLKFYFAPQLKPLLFTPVEELPEGTDAWAFAKGYVTVTPISAVYSGLAEGGCAFASEDGQGWQPGKLWD